MSRLWRTDAGDLVSDGHPDAVTLAYGDGDPVPETETIRKQARTPRDKKSAPPANKGS